MEHVHFKFTMGNQSSSEREFYTLHHIKYTEYVAKIKPNDTVIANIVNLYKMANEIAYEKRNSDKYSSYAGTVVGLEIALQQLFNNRVLNPVVKNKEFECLCPENYFLHRPM